MSTIAQLVRQFREARSPAEKRKIANMLFHVSNVSALKHCAGKQRHAKALHGYRNIVALLRLAIAEFRDVSPTELESLEHYCLLACLEASSRARKKTPSSEPMVGVEDIPSEKDNPLTRLIWEYRLAPAKQKWMDLIEKIVEELRPKLWKFICASCWSRDHEDVLQETLLSIILSVWRFDGKTDAQFQTYCFRIAEGIIAESAPPGRDVTTDPEDFETKLDALAQEKFESDEQRARLRANLALLRCLKKRSRALVWLHCARGHSIKDIARRYGLKYDAVQKEIYRSLKRIRSQPRKEF